MKIIVNGVAHKYQDEKIGYEEVAKLANGGNSRELMVTYFWSNPLHPDLTRRGTLPYGIWKRTCDGHLRKTIRVADGMIFTAVRTGAA
jgi:hypothetical protein